MSEPLDARLFAQGPARDARFDVRERWRDLVNLPPEHALHQLEFLHRQMNEELNGLEIAARNLSDFPDADWDLRLAIARQCWDEARHVELFRRSYELRGGRVGQFPVMNFQFRITTRLPSLLGRLAVQNRSFEAAGLDAIDDSIEKARASGEQDLAELLDTQLPDELQHVRYANEWVRRLVERAGARAAFDVVRSVAQAEAALREVAGDAEVRYPVSEQLRREAGFTEGEIDQVRP